MILFRKIDVLSALIFSFLIVVLNVAMTSLLLGKNILLLVAFYVTCIILIALFQL